MRILGEEFNALEKENCTMMIDGKKESFKKLFDIGTKGEYKVKVIMKRGKIINSKDNMFQESTSLTYLDMPKFNTSRVTSMKKIVSCCIHLTSLNLNNFDTSNVLNMYGMFYYFTFLTSLDLMNFDTSKIEDMSYFIYFCYSLSSLDASI